MTDRDTGLELLRAELAALARHAENGPECPAPERIWRAVAGELSPVETRELVEHTTTCPACAEDWRLAREVRRRADLPGAGASPTRRRRIAWGAAAAAVLLGALILVPKWRSGPVVESPSSVRAPEPADRIRSLTLDRTPLPRDGCTLRWSAELGPAVEYDVLVATAELDVLFSAQGLEEPVVRVPPEALDPVPAGGTLLWQVVARLPGGRRVTSATFVNRLE